MSWLDGDQCAGLDHVELECPLDGKGRQTFLRLLEDHVELRALREQRLEVAGDDGSGTLGSRRA